MLPSYPVPQPIIGFQAFPAEFRDAANNARRPSIEVRFPGQLVGIRAVRIRVRRQGTTTVVFDAELPYGDALTNPAERSVILNGVFLPNTIYEVQGELVPFEARDADPTGWFLVLTPNILLGPGDIDYNAIEERLRYLDDFANRGVREAIEEARRKVVQDWEAVAGAYLDRQTLRRDIAAESGANRARFSEQIDAAAGPNSVIVQRLTVAENGLTGLSTALSVVTQRVDNVDGQLVVVSHRLDDYGVRITGAEGTIVAPAGTIIAIQNSVTAVKTTANGRNRVYRQSATPNATAVGDLWIHTGENNSLYRASATGGANWVLSEDQRIPTLVSDVAAQSSLINQLNALVGPNAAGGLLRIAARATPAGAEASIALSVAASAGAAASAAAMYLDAITGGLSRIAMVANQIVWTNGTTYARPMVFQGSTLVLDQLKVRWADIETLVANNLVVTGAMIDTLTVRDVIMIPGSASDDVSTTTVLTGISAGGAWW